MTDMKKPYHVVVTGGAGYIGSVLVPLLLDEGYHVTIYDKFVYGVHTILHVAHHENVTMVYGDINDSEKLDQILVDADGVIHLAAIVGFPACNENPKLTEKVNVDGTKTITDLLKPHQNIIFASTGSCYGAVKGICTESNQINPLTLYGKTKAEGEKIILAAGGTALRLATVFGLSPRLRLDLLVNDLTLCALTNGNIDLFEPHVMRTFLHVRDAAQAFLFAIKNYNIMKGQVFNVGDEKMNMTKGELVNQIQKLVKECTITVCTGEDKDKRDYHVSYKKICDLGFKSTLSIEQGVSELMKVLSILTKEEIIKASNGLGI